MVPDFIKEGEEVVVEMVKVMNHDETMVSDAAWGLPVGSSLP